MAISFEDISNSIYEITGKRDLVYQLLILNVHIKIGIDGGWGFLRGTLFDQPFFNRTIDYYSTLKV